MASPRCPQRTLVGGTSATDLTQVPCRKGVSSSCLTHTVPAHASSVPSLRVALPDCCYFCYTWVRGDTSPVSYYHQNCWCFGWSPGERENDSCSHIHTRSLKRYFGCLILSLQILAVPFSLCPFSNVRLQCLQPPTPLLNASHQPVPSLLAPFSPPPWLTLLLGHTAYVPSPSH